MTYSLAGYAAMVGDRVRTSAYAAALRETVKPGSVVADIGTGTGYFAVLACKLGAKRVYAIEPDKTAIAVARETAVRNDVQDRIVFLNELSTQSRLPEPADVIVSDLRGVLPLNEFHIPSIADARERLLRLGGALIPLRDEIFAAPAWAPETYAKHCAPWESSAPEIDVTSWSRYATNFWVKARLEPSALLASPVSLGVLDYKTRSDSSFIGKGEWKPGRSAEMNGVAVWFDATLTENVTFSSAPGAAETIYGGAFFPLSEPTAIRAGDTINLVLAADLIHGKYVWRWTTRITGADGSASREFVQSNFFSSPVDHTLLAHARGGSTPSLSAAGTRTYFCLGQMDGTRSLDSIAAAVQATFPDDFPDIAAAKAFAAAVSAEFASSESATTAASASS